MSAKKGYSGGGGGGGTTQLILNLGIKMNGQPHALAALPHQRNPIPIVQRLGEQGPGWMVTESLAITGIRHPDRPVGSE